MTIRFGNSTTPSTGLQTPSPGVGRSQLELRSMSTQQSSAVQISGGVLSHTTSPTTLGTVSTSTGLWLSQPFITGANVVGGSALYSSMDIQKSVSGAPHYALALQNLAAISTGQNITLQMKAADSADVWYLSLTQKTTEITGTEMTLSQNSVGTPVTVNGTSMTLASVSVTSSIKPLEGVVGTTTSGAATTGIVGEYLETVISTSTTYPTTSGAFCDLTSLGLTPGDWDVVGTAFYLTGTSTSVATMGLGLSPTSSATLPWVPAAAYPDNFATYTVAGPYGIGNFSITVPRYRVSLSSSQTWYLKGYMEYTAGTPGYMGKISARRVR